jgi:signal transduction histidine kinase
MVLARISEQAGQLNRLVDDLSTASRMDAEQLTVQVETVDVTQLLGEVVADYRFRFPSRDFALTGVPIPAVKADRVRLRQVLTNLLDNALKYSPPRSPIRVDASARHRRWVEVSIADQGAGIELDEQPRIFEPFYRSRKSAEATSGIGLGLTIAAGLARAMHGDLRVESRPGQGARFTISLPAAA